MAMMISWVALVNPFIRPWRMTRLRRLTPTICAFHLGFSLVGLEGNDAVVAHSEFPPASREVDVLGREAQEAGVGVDGLLPKDGPAPEG